MELLAPEIVAEVRTLSAGLGAGGLAIGLALGLLGVLLFRFWIMALTSAGGALLMGYARLGLADHFLKCDAVAFSAKHAVLLNWVCGVTALLGLVAQFFLTRRRARKGSPSGKG